ncbi:MAG: glycine cleavage system protein GcvH [Gammaproteobacteria bacterium]|nr:glycine cleavage system protein GcvH [Gammaproteobacteria bacterium]
MAEVPGDLKFAETHEWARVESDGNITVGISDHAQDSLGDVVFVELPEVDMEVEAKAEAGVVESVKAASDIYAPVGGTVIAINEALEDAPETVNESPYDDGWFFKLKHERSR